MKCLLLLLLPLFCHPLFGGKTVNVYVWGGEIPKKLIHQFERETGITVNFSTYDSNETMYAKLKTSAQNLYDVILPSGYYIERMQKQGMLTKLDLSKLTNLNHLDPWFTQNDYDPGNQYSAPITWGITGIFYNRNRVKEPPKSWNQLWKARWRQQLLLLDDFREVFSMALMSLGYHPNDNDALHIQAAYQKLLSLVPNIKLFSNESVQAMMIDEDAIVGMAWNGDAYKAQLENDAIDFIYPKDGFIIWVDCLAIPANPPHLEEAYQFINFMLKPSSAVEIALSEGHAITNTEGKALLPESVRDNTMIYPRSETLKRGYFQRDVDDKTITLYYQYWEQLKLAF